MALDIDSLLRPQTADQIEATLLGILDTLGVQARTWRKGGMARVLLRAFATQCAGFSVLLTDLAKGGFLDTAEKGWLTLLAYYHYGVTRREATFATGQVTLVNTGGGVWEYDPDELIFVNPDTGATYALAQSFALTTPGQSVTVDIRATEPGTGFNSLPGTITEIQPDLDGVTVTNAAAVLGTDAWTDAELRAVCKAKLSALSTNGPRGAYEYAILTATRTSGEPVNINRYAISPSSSQGIVTVYLASPSGVPTTEDIDAVKANIEAIARPETVRCFVYAATPIVVHREVEAWADKPGGVTAEYLEDLIQTKVQAFVSSYPIGGRRKLSTQGYLYADRVEGIITGAHDAILDVDGFGADIALAEGEIAVLNLSVVVRFPEAG